MRARQIAACRSGSPSGPIDGDPGRRAARAAAGLRVDVDRERLPVGPRVLAAGSRPATARTGLVLLVLAVRRVVDGGLLRGRRARGRPASGCSGRSGPRGRSRASCRRRRSPRGSGRRASRRARGCSRRRGRAGTSRGRPAGPSRRRRAAPRPWRRSPGRTRSCPSPAGVFSASASEALASARRPSAISARARFSGPSGLSGASSATRVQAAPRL